MSETKTPEKPEETEIPDASEIAELAEMDSLEDRESDEADLGDSPSIKEALHSHDAPSRYIMVLSLVFAFLALLCFGLLLFQYWKHRHGAVKPVPAVVEIYQAEPSYEQPLGEFKILWEDSEMTAELNAECSSAKACEELKNRLIEVQDLLAPVLQASSRNDVLNPARKLLLRQQLAEKLNEMKLSGRITQIDFSDLTIEPVKKHE